MLKCSITGSLFGSLCMQFSSLEKDVLSRFSPNLAQLKPIYMCIGHCNKEMGSPCLFSPSVPVITILMVWWSYDPILMVWGLRSGSKVCSKHMNDWQYLSLEDLEKNLFFPKSKSWGFLVPSRLIFVTWHDTWPKSENEGNWRIHCGEFTLFG